MSKTPGQELYDILNPYDPSACANPAQWHETDEDFQAHYERCSAELRNAIIEECAKVAEADDSFMMLQDWGLQNAVTQKGENIAQALRALKSAGKEDGNG